MIKNEGVNLDEINWHLCVNFFCFIYDLLTAGIVPFILIIERE
jgi:hypothetical protein